VRLNGWQRLWCVLSVVLAVVIGRDAYLHVPTADKIRRDAALEALRTSPDSPIPPFPDQVAACKRNAGTDIERKKCDPPAPTPEETAAYDREIQIGEDHIKNGLRTEQFQQLAEAGALWLLVVIAIYAAGWTVGWVFRGFRTPRSHPDTPE